MDEPDGAQDGADTSLYSVRDDLRRDGPDPESLFPPAVTPVVFRSLWAALVVLLVILGWLVVQYGDRTGWSAW